MFQKQLRYVQIILTLATFAGLLLNNSPLLSAAFVGLILIWHLEMLTGQLRIDTNEYFLICYREKQILQTNATICSNLN